MINYYIIEYYKTTVTFMCICSVHLISWLMLKLLLILVPSQVLQLLEVLATLIGQVVFLSLRRNRAAKLGVRYIYIYIYTRVRDIDRTKED